MQDAAHIKPLTSLRFFAALWVVLFHYWPKLDASFTPAFVERGYLGVEAFFTLSGFILCHVYLSSVEEGRFKYGGFLWNRLARVYPLHLATLIGMGLMAGAALAAGFAIDSNILSWASLPANLLLVQAWGFAPTAGWNHPSWSISAEWFAYLSFPAFAWAALKLKNRPWLGLFLAASALAALYAIYQGLTGEALTSATIHWGALRIVPCFALGCALFLVWKSGVADRRLAAFGAGIFGSLVVIGALFSAPDAVIVICLGGLILSLALLAKAGSAFFSAKPFVYLGEISYSTYMICVPWKLLFVNAAAKFFNIADERLPWYLWLVFLGALVPLSAMSYHLIESPARAGMKLLAKRHRPHDLATAEAR